MDVHRNILSGFSLWRKSLPADGRVVLEAYRDDDIAHRRDRGLLILDVTVYNRLGMTTLHSCVD